MNFKNAGKGALKHSALSLEMPLQAILWNAEVWSSMNPKTIPNCWKITKILPELLDQDLEESSENPVPTAEIHNLISKLPLGEDALSAQEYLDLPDVMETEEELTTKQLIEAVNVSC